MFEEYVILGEFVFDLIVLVCIHIMKARVLRSFNEVTLPRIE